MYFRVWKKTVLTNDLAAQYTDFFSYFKSFFTGENNLYIVLVKL